MNNSGTSIENTEVKMSLKIIYSIIISTAVTVLTVSGLYFKMENKNEIQDLQFQVLKLQVDKIEIELKEMQSRIDRKADKI